MSLKAAICLPVLCVCVCSGLFAFVIWHTLKDPHKSITCSLVAVWMSAVRPSRLELWVFLRGLRKQLQKEEN